MCTSGTGASNPVLSDEPKTAHATLDHRTMYISLDSGLMSSGYDERSKRVLSDLGCSHFTQGPALVSLKSVGIFVVTVIPDLLVAACAC